MSMQMLGRRPTHEKTLSSDAMMEQLGKRAGYRRIYLLSLSFKDLERLARRHGLKGPTLRQWSSWRAIGA